MRKTECDTILNTAWNELIARLSKFTEDELQQLLEHERNNRKRPHVMRRVHARYNKVRAAREREEFIHGEDDTE